MNDNFWFSFVCLLTVFVDYFVQFRPLLGKTYTWIGFIVPTQ